MEHAGILDTMAILHFCNHPMGRYEVYVEAASPLNVSSCLDNAIACRAVCPGLIPVSVIAVFKSGHLKLYSLQHELSPHTRSWQMYRCRSPR